MTTVFEGPSVEPFYFNTERPLYGCFHRPQGHPRSSSVLLCYPWGDEYLRFHRSFRRWAELLANEGLSVLRFDLSGCGDSAGDPLEWNLDQWRADLIAAVRELRRRTGGLPVALAGLRLGATLAAFAAAGVQDLSALVLWDPVVDGAAYLRELHALQRTMLARAHALPLPPPSPAGVSRPAVDTMDESLGFPLPPGLCAALSSLHLELPLPGRETPTLLLQTRSDLHGGSPTPPLPPPFECLCLSQPELWQWREALAHVYVPQRVLQEAVAWLARVCP